MSFAAAAIVIGAGSFIAAREQERQGDISAGVISAQAANERRLATLALLRGQADEERVRSIGRRRQGAQVAAVAVSGVALEGSPLDVLVDQAVQDDLEARTVGFNAREEARARRFNAQVLDIKAKQVDRAAEIDAFGTILGGAFNIGRLGAAS